MDISSLIGSPNLLGLTKPSENPLNLKIGQQLDVKVINADIQAAKNTVTLSIAGKEVTVQSSQPVTLNRGQDLKIQVTQLTPTTEFKFVEPPPGQREQTAEPRLKLIQVVKDSGQENARQSPAPPDAKNAAAGKEIVQTVAKDARAAANPEQMRTTIKDTGTVPVNKEPAVKDNANAAIARQITPETAGTTGAKQPAPTAANAAARPAIGDKPESPAPSLPVKQLLDAKIASVDGNKIQLQFSGSDNKPVLMVTIDRAQLTNAPAELKPGQNLNLEMVKTGAVPEFKVVNPATYIPEAKVAEFVKQFLPRHEAAPVLLNQLIKDLPRIVKNPNVPQVVKDLAANIVQNLPPKEQLITSQGLKQSIVNSGLFLEAKLLPIASQMELIQQLPQLIQNETVPQSLQRIAAGILQNLTQKQPLPGNAEPEEPVAAVANLEPEAEVEPTTTKQPVPNAPQTTAQEPAVAEDFKANLLKFIQTLKQEISLQGQQAANPADLDLLKNLQHKSENAVAKLVLDQLGSLPKEDSPKQVWVIDLPFVDRQQAESVRIEVQRDKESNPQFNNNAWSVNITITPPELGTIHCIVSYRDDRVNTFFKSQSNRTTDLIKHNLDYLKNQLEESGLKTGQMDAHAEQRKIPAVAAQQLEGRKLFDDKA